MMNWRFCGFVLGIALVSQGSDAASSWLFLGRSQEYVETSALLGANDGAWVWAVKSIFTLFIAGILFMYRKRSSEVCLYLASNGGRDFLMDFFKVMVDARRRSRSFVGFLAISLECKPKVESVEYVALVFLTLVTMSIATLVFALSNLSVALTGYGVFDLTMLIIAPLAIWMKSDPPAWLFGAATFLMLSLLLAPLGYRVTRLAATRSGIQIATT